ncbi:DNA endonuclease SmrA [Porticoccaceae bacterium]|nr:DNA endonuclease SmrA [Porticoccaceae bacterium]MDB2566826.1 DNA endonuclease SmrA [Porticoccaceae bacterium]MDB2621421.1 DNA endonuclease SmrA [Porticoccaceae bacterium]
MSPTDDKIKSSLDDSDGSFGDLVGDGVKPLSANVSSHIVPTKEITPGIIERRKAAQREVVSDVNELDTASVIEPVEPLAYLEYQRPGVQHGVYKNLRLGKYEIQSRLDLHRHTVEQARVALWRFVDDCHKHSIRCALITHGKGEGRQEPAKLKSCVNHWLRQFDEVLAFHSAQKQHGGVGCTYVLIKKDRSARQKTSEKIDHSRRIKR